MPFTIPDEAEATYPEQSGLYQTDVNALVAGQSGNGVVSGCAVTAQGTPDGTVAVAAGTAAVAGAAVTVAGGNVTVTDGHATLKRIDLIVVDNTGAKSCTAGTASATPVAPDIPANSVLLAMVFRPAAATTATTAMIVDKRVEVVAARATNGKGFVNHGSTAGTARPSGFASIEWFGTVEPTNAINGDTWNQP